MKNLNLIISVLLFYFLTSCSKTENKPNSQNSSSSCGSYNDKPTYKGSQNGCYYINSNGNKTYIDSQYCPC